MTSLPSLDGAATASSAADSTKPEGAARVGSGRGHGADPHHSSNLWFLALTALGVVYGDIGTSPLYAFQVALSGLGHPAPAPHEVFGIVSLIFWALMLMVSLKYVVFVLRADNEGEGGILALLSLVGGDRVRDGSRLPILVLLGIIGAALLYGDGVITPAISVLSAMEGLKLVAPSLRQIHRAGDTCDPDWAVFDPATGDRKHRQAVRPRHGGLVRDDRAAWGRKHLDAAGDPLGRQSAGGRRTFSSASRSLRSRSSAPCFWH